MGRLPFKLTGLLFSAACFLLACGVPAKNPTGDDEAASLRNLLINKKFVETTIFGQGYAASILEQAIEAVYYEHAFHPLWLVRGALSERGQKLLNGFKSVAGEGLSPNDYLPPPELLHTTQSFESQAVLDLFLTLSTLRLIIDGKWGRALLRQADGEEAVLWENRRDDFVVSLRNILANDDPYAAIVAHFPTHNQYRLLKSELNHYQEIVDDGRYRMISKGRSLKTGMRDRRVDTLRQNLALLGDIDDYEADNDSFDTALSQALEHFQIRHGLKPNGILDAETIDELNVPLNQRLNTLVINLERWRWLPDERETQKQVWVNIAGFELAALSFHKILLRSAVIVGKQYLSTPLLSSYINAVEFNPAWNVPRSIFVNELLPKLKRDSNSLKKDHMRLIGPDGKEVAADDSILNRKWNSLQVRQDPGPWNALGRIKFHFPNRFQVYLHDTPTKQLFARERRSFSHGCIRVAETAALAAFLLDEEDDHWTAERATTIAESDEHKVIKLRHPVRIHVSYRTAWVGLDGELNLRPDIYGRDARMIDALAASDGKYNLSPLAPFLSAE